MAGGSRATAEEEWSSADQRVSPSPKGIEEGKTYMYMY